MLSDQECNDLRSGIAIELEDKFGTYKMRKLSALSEKIEVFLMRKLCEVLWQNCSTFLQGSKPSNTEWIVTLPSSSAEIVVAENAREFDLLEVVIVDRSLETTKARRRQKTFRLAGLGRFSRLRVIYSSRHVPDLDCLHALCLTVIETIYKWIEDSVVSTVLSIESDLATTLYRYMRSVFPCEELLERVRFVAFKDGVGFYLLDSRCAVATLKAASSVPSQYALAPVQVVSEIYRCKLALGNTATKDAISSNKCIDVKLESTPYYSDRRPLAYSEAALYASNAVSIFPILDEGKRLLVATFPTENRSVLEPLLRAHKNALKDRFVKHQRWLKRILDGLSQWAGDVTPAMIVDLGTIAARNLLMPPGG